MIIARDRVVEDPNFRQRFIAVLQIPTYFQLTKVMFYDTLQQICDKKNLIKFHYQKMADNNKEAMVLQQFSGGRYDEIGVVMK